MRKLSISIFWASVTVIVFWGLLIIAALLNTALGRW